MEEVRRSLGVCLQVSSKHKKNVKNLLLKNENQENLHF